MITEKELKELWRKEDYRIQVEDLGYETCMLGWIFNLLQETIEADRKTFVSQELAELREWYPDALFKAEDLSRQVELLLPQIKRLADEAKEIVICSAIRMPDGEIFRGHRHCHCIQMGYELVTHRHEKFGGPEWHCPYGDGQGFISSKNRYVTREEGMRLQLAAGIESVAKGGYRGSILFSEDLY